MLLELRQSLPKSEDGYLLQRVFLDALTNFLNTLTLVSCSGNQFVRFVSDNTMTESLPNGTWIFSANAWIRDMEELTGIPLSGLDTGKFKAELQHIFIFQ